MEVTFKKDARIVVVVSDAKGRPALVFGRWRTIALGQSSPADPAWRSDIRIGVCVELTQRAAVGVARAWEATPMRSGIGDTANAPSDGNAGAAEWYTGVHE
jgi:hypothetical protein